MIREDLRLSIKLLSFYESINYYTTCKELSDKYRKSDERLEKTDKNKVFEIFKSLGYELVTYNSKERFYRIMKEKLKIVFDKIKFVNRYQKICEKHGDFDNRMSKNNKKLTSNTLDLFKYNYKYFTNGSFYQIKEEKDDIIFQLHLVLKGGVVESLLSLYI